MWFSFLFANPYYCPAKIPPLAPFSAFRIPRVGNYLPSVLPDGTPFLLQDPSHATPPLPFLAHCPKVQLCRVRFSRPRETERLGESSQHVDTGSQDTDSTTARHTTHSGRT